MCKTIDCLNPIENKDTGLCASCGRNARKVPKAVKKTAIKKRSEKGQKIASELAKVYKVVDSITSQFCGNCGSNKTEHSHILPQGQYPEHRLNPINIFRDCRGCHLIWEHGTLSEVENLKDWPKRLKVIEKLEPIYFFRRFKVNIEYYANRL